MRIGLIGDIHANLPALRVVLDDLDSISVDMILNAGDLVGYGPFPNQVIDIVRERGIMSIMGNRDMDVCQSSDNPHSVEHSQGTLSAEQLKLASYGCTYRELTPENRLYLKSLPERLTVPIESHKILMVHDRFHPKTPTLRTNMPDSEFKKVAEMVPEDILVAGHTHIPFVRQVANKTFINTGSVGRSADGDIRAAYVLLEVKKDCVTAQIKRLSYDIEETIRAIQTSDLPDEFALMFRYGRELSKLMD